MNTAEQYYWITNHPEFDNAPKGKLGITLEFTPMMVNPEDDHVADDAKLNTKLVWWVETMQAVAEEGKLDIQYYHEWALDSGGDTAEEAVADLYLLVKQYYGDYDGTI